MQVLQKTLFHANLFATFDQSTIRQHINNQHKNYNNINQIFFNNTRILLNRIVKNPKIIVVIYIQFQQPSINKTQSNYCLRTKNKTKIYSEHVGGTCFELMIQSTS